MAPPAAKLSPPPAEKNVGETAHESVPSCNSRVQLESCWWRSAAPRCSISVCARHPARTLGPLASTSVTALPLFDGENGAKGLVSVEGVGHHLSCRVLSFLIWMRAARCDGHFFFSTCELCEVRPRAWNGEAGTELIPCRWGAEATEVLWGVMGEWGPDGVGIARRILTTPLIGRLRSVLRLSGLSYGFFFFFCSPGGSCTTRVCLSLTTVKTPSV